MLFFIPKKVKGHYDIVMFCTNTLLVFTECHISGAGVKFVRIFNI